MWPSQWPLWEPVVIFNPLRHFFLLSAGNSDTGSAVDSVGVIHGAVTTTTPCDTSTGLTLIR